MDELLKNAEEFLESGNDNLKKQRFNASVSDYFKTIVILCDYIIYKEIKVMPKNHNERFSLLGKYFKNIYEEVSQLFKIYIKFYNLRLDNKDAETLKNYADKFKNNIPN